MKVGDHAMYGGDEVVIFERHPDGWVRANFVEGGTLSCHESRLLNMRAVDVLVAIRRRELS